MDALDALDRFKSSGNSEKITGFKKSPTLKFSKEGNQFVWGILRGRRELVESKAGKSVLTIELIETNAQFTVQKDEGYVPVPVNPGDQVGVFAPTALDRTIKDIPEGTEVYIKCDGKVKERNAAGKPVEFYKFDVRTKAKA